MLDVIESKSLMKSAQVFEKRIKKELVNTIGIKEVRGRGLLIGIELEEPMAKEVAAALLDAGVIVNPANPTAIRIAPPLIVSAAQIEKFLTIFKKVLKEVTRG